MSAAEEICQADEPGRSRIFLYYNFIPLVLFGEIGSDIADPCRNAYAQIKRVEFLNDEGIQEPC